MEAEAAVESAQRHSSEDIVSVGPFSTATQSDIKMCMPMNMSMHSHSV